MAIKLVIIDTSGSLPPLTQEWDQSLITFGRSKSCHVELDNPGISRRHFIVKFNDQSYILIDENSRHGTTLDGERLVPQTAYELKHEHTISLPGFVIKLLSDGKKPKMERTLVVARQLLDELLQDTAKPREIPCLQSQDGRYQFNFLEEKVSFVLGVWPDVDFIVSSPHIAKKHVSFARDINGIRLIPLPAHQVFINGQPSDEPTILTEGVCITIGDIEFVYHEHGPAAHKTAILLNKMLHSEQEITSPPPKTPPVMPQKNKVFWALDRLFLLAFVAVLAGASLVLYEMM